MAQQYGLGNAFSDILNSYVGMKQTQQNNALAQQQLELRRQQMAADQAYRDRLLGNQDREFNEGVRQADREYNLKLPGVESQNRSFAAAADDAELAATRKQNAQNMSIFQGEFDGAPTVNDVNDILAGNRSKENGLRAMFANPNVVRAFGGQVDDIFVLPGTENRPEGPLYGIGVLNSQTGTRGPVTSGRGTARDEIVAIYDANGLQQALTAGYDVATGESGIAPARGLVSALNASLKNGRAAEQTTVRNIDPRQFAVNAADMQEVEQQRSTQPAPPQTQINATRLGQLQDASTSLATQIAEQANVVSGLDDVPGSAQQLATAEARLGQLQNQKAQIDERIAAETPRPDAADSPRPQPQQQGSDVKTLLDGSASRVQSGAQTLAAPFINMAQQGANQRNAAAAYTGNQLSDRQLGSVLSMQTQGLLQPAQVSNIIGSGDPSGAREQRIVNRMSDGSNVMTGSMDNARSVVENVNDNETSRLDETLTTFQEMREAELDAITEGRVDEQETLDAFQEDGTNAAVSEGYTGPFADRVGARYRQAASSEFANSSVVAAVVRDRYRGQDLAQSFTRMEAALSRFGQGDRITSDDNWLERNISSLANPIRKYWTGNTISQDQSLGMAVLSDILGIPQMDFLVDVANPAISGRSNFDPLSAERLQYAILVAGTPEFAKAGSRIRKAEMTRLLQMPTSEFNQYVEDITGEKP